MLTEWMNVEVEGRYGPLYDESKSGKLTLFNEQSFAKLYELAAMPIFLPKEKTFYHYDPATGLWSSQSTEEMLDRLGLFLHECAVTWKVPAIEEKRKLPILSSILKFLAAMCRRQDFFNRSIETFVHCANGVLELDPNGEWALKPFSPEYHSRNRCEIPYIPGMDCPRFLNELLHPLVENDDIELVQQYIGQCLTGKNITQSILLLTGSAGSGKGTLANIVEGMVGNGNFTQIRPENITGRFETSFFMDKTLLTGKESNTSFFSTKGMQVLKSLVGDDKLRAEYKNSNRHEMIDGVYNMFIVGNPTPILGFEGKEDQSAWARRLRWVKCKTYKPTVPIPFLARKLIEAEGPGILNWTLTGARKILRSGSSNLPCNALQTARLDYLFNSASPLDFFLASMVKENRGTTITSDELFLAFVQFGQAMEWQSWSRREFQKQISDMMLRRFRSPLRRDVPRMRADGKMTNRAGFYHIAFKS